MTQSTPPAPVRTARRTSIGLALGALLMVIAAGSALGTIAFFRTLPQATPSASGQVSLTVKVIGVTAEVAIVTATGTDTATVQSTSAQAVEHTWRPDIPAGGTVTLTALMTAQLSADDESGFSGITCTIADSDGRVLSTHSSKSLSQPAVCTWTNSK